jgi:osmoprotectant transport system ATP-binding protein
VEAAATIEFCDVFYRPPGGALVFDGLTLSIQAGEVMVLVGRSGAGKTTLLRLVNRLLLPDAGSVLVEGRDTRAWPPIRLRRSVGYVIQDVGLFPHLNVADNIAVVPRLEKWDAARIAHRTAELLELIGLPAATYADRWPDELSGGQRQRIGVARALAADPPVLLMDEPFGALDPLTRAEIQAEFRHIQARLHKTVILVTHDIAEAMALGDRLAVLDKGRLVACDSPAAVATSTDPRIRQLFEGPSRQATWSALRDREGVI